jgi:hypothetical protein
MGVKATPQAAAEAWSTGFGGSTAKYTAGINSVTIAPGQLAAAQKALYVQNVTAQADNWAGKVASVSLPDWKAAATGVGAQRLVTGATKGLPKMQSFMQSFLPQLSSIVDGLGPRGSFEQNMQRSMSYASALHTKKGQF